MKMSINSMLLISTLSVAVWGCAAADTVVGVDPANVKMVTANVNANAIQIAGSADSEDPSKFDFFKDHSFEIKEEIKDVALLVMSFKFYALFFCNCLCLIIG